MDPNNIGPPSMWSNPDWWESIIAVFVGACGLIAWVMKVWIINPANKRADETRGTLVKIDSEMSKDEKEKFLAHTLHVSTVYQTVKEAIKIYVELA